MDWSDDGGADIIVPGYAHRRGDSGNLPDYVAARTPNR